MRAIITAAALLCACGKHSEPEHQSARPAVVPARVATDDSPLFSLDTGDPAIPAVPNHTQAHPGPDDALKADRAGLTVGSQTKNLRIDWLSEPAPGGGVKVWAKSVVVTYRMDIAIYVSSNFKEGTCPYRVTWEHELDHANAYVSMFDASKVHLLAALEHSQELGQPIPTASAPALVKAEEADDFKKGFGQKIVAVIEDQQRVLETLMADHKRDRDSPAAYKRDTDKCPMEEWLAGRSS